MLILGTIIVEVEELEEAAAEGEEEVNTE